MGTTKPNHTITIEKWNFESQALRKGRCCMDGIDKGIIAPYARGLSTCGERC